MKDFSHWKEYEGAAEGSGRSEKQWLIDPCTSQIALFKYKKDSNTTDHVSECIACGLAVLIGIPCAHFEIGTFHGREGSISYNIVEHNGMTLIEGIVCISKVYEQFDTNKLIDTKTGERYSLEMIKKVLDDYELFEDFLPILIFDFLIGNTDRHQSNWALIQENQKYRLSPLYDNSSSLCAYVSETTISQYFEKDLTKWNSLVDTKSKSMIRIHSKDKKRPTHTDMLKYLKDKYYKQTKNIVYIINKFITKDRIHNIIEKYDEALPQNKKLLIEKYLLSKLEILQSIYKKKE